MLCPRLHTYIHPSTSPLSVCPRLCSKTLQVNSGRGSIDWLARDHRGAPVLHCSKSFQQTPWAPQKQVCVLSWEAEWTPLLLEILITLFLIAPWLSCRLPGVEGRG